MHVQKLYIVRTCTCTLYVIVCYMGLQVDTGMWWRQRVGLQMCCFSATWRREKGEWTYWVHVVTCMLFSHPNICAPPPLSLSLSLPLLPPSLTPQLKEKAALSHHLTLVNHGLSTASIKLSVDEGHFSISGLAPPTSGYITLQPSQSANVSTCACIAADKSLSVDLHMHAGIGMHM